MGSAGLTGIVGAASSQDALRVSELLARLTTEDKTLLTNLRTLVVQVRLCSCFESMLKRVKLLEAEIKSDYNSDTFAANVETMIAELDKQLVEIFDIEFRSIAEALVSVEKSDGIEKVLKSGQLISEETLVSASQETRDSIVDSVGEIIIGLNISKLDKELATHAMNIVSGELEAAINNLSFGQRNTVGE